MSRTISPPAFEASSIGDVQHIVLDDVSWELYEKLLKEVGDRAIRMTYDDGTLEIMSPIAEHEDPKKVIARMIEMLTLELDMPVKSLGSTTFRRKDKAKGLEPDECYYFRDEKKMRGRKRLDLRRDPAPELVLEIDITSRSIAREPIYAALGVPEIWRYDGRKLQSLRLQDGDYCVRKYSLAFLFLHAGDLEQFIRMLSNRGETATMRAFIAWVRGNGWTAP
jgi:Uma2 family endonuclease